ncbi:RES family NAD+ phosphorylase [candidate division KSB1 bacterium]|nr:RES family NAD+ phosphorylase [candidate division KSB1 bacterium]
MYEPSDDASAKPLFQSIQEDWMLFNPKIREDGIISILEDICADTQLPRQPHVPVKKPNLSKISQWNEFKEEIKHKNRFFPQKAPDIENLPDFFELLEIPSTELPEYIFRARIQKKDTSIPLEEMDKPSPEQSSNGRANPNGISYLYAAKNYYTAISEVRPYKGEMVTVARFRLKNDTKILDLRNPRVTISPFDVVEEESLASLHAEMPYLVMLGEVLSEPVVPRVADLEYLPSQYLCEFIKHRKFDGIMYKSSLTEGDNLALFSEDSYEPVDKQDYKVTSNNIEVVKT